MRIVAVEGTPEELARFENLTGWVFTTDEMLNGERSEDGWVSSGLDADLTDFLLSRAQNKARFELARDFVERALARGDIEAEPGKKMGSKDGLGKYLRLYRKGPRRYGAAVYLTPGSGRADIRLPKEAAVGRAHAKARDPKSDAEYNVRVHLGSEEAIAEALELLGEAIRRLEEA